MRGEIPIIFFIMSIVKADESLATHLLEQQSKLQDVIQEKLEAAHVMEDLQDKLGNFALLVINNEFILAKKVELFTFSHLC